jgi:hypothetical protein
MCDFPTIIKGMRVRTKGEIDRFPHFKITKKGLQGEVTAITDSFIQVKMDKCIEGAKDWENCIEWYAGTSYDDFWNDMEIAPERKTFTELKRQIAQTMDELATDDFVDLWNYLYPDHKITEDDVDWE